MDIDRVGAVCRTRATLRRIAERDDEVRAWTHVDAAGALERAAALDRAGPRDTQPLWGVPIGVKDVIDVEGMPTSHNSPLSNGVAAVSDAACVATLRAAGAIVIGKTDTTEFAAAGRNAATANPFDPARTPGGSSSGSAAAVADGHVPIAIATQTGGSTIRPASFCGVHALKPTWGQISREGAKLYAGSLDTIGFYAADQADLDRICAVFGFAPPSMPPPSRLRIGLCRTPWWPLAEGETRRAMGAASDRLARAGHAVCDFDLPDMFASAEAHFRTLLFREGRAAFLDLQRTMPDLLHRDFHDRVDSVRDHSDAMLGQAYDFAACARIALEADMQGFDAVLTPSAPGVAPSGRGPGNPIFNQLWTMLHVPVVHMPLFRERGLPIGLSLVGPRFADRQLIAIAARVVAAVGVDAPLA